MTRKPRSQVPIRLGPLRLQVLGRLVNLHERPDYRIIEPTGVHVRQRRLVPSELRNVSFPIAVRGYERHAVDTYVARVNRVIAELEATHSPEAAVRHALHRVEEQTRGTLEHARERADELTAAAQRRAEDTLARAKAEAADIVVNAETQVDRATLAADAHAAEVKSDADAYVAKARAEAEDILARARREAEESLRRSREEIASVRGKAEAWATAFSADSEAIRKERLELLDDVRELALRLASAADDATARLPTEDLEARSRHAGSLHTPNRD